MIVAIDGPSGAGKSSVAKIVARELGFSSLDTGAMYRVVALKALRQGVSLEDAQALKSISDQTEITFGHESGNPAPKYVFADGVDVTDDIRTSEIDKAVSPVSACSAVRTSLVAKQQKIGEMGDYVVEGRDIGTVVFPDAEVKIFLTASPEERAHRRVRQNVDRSVGSINYEEVLQDIKRRDEVDSNREFSPLSIASDAHVLDSTGKHIEDVIEEICTLAKSRM